MLSPKNDGFQVGKYTSHMDPIWGLCSCTFHDRWRPWCLHLDKLLKHRFDCVQMRDKTCFVSTHIFAYRHVNIYMKCFR